MNHTFAPGMPLQTIIFDFGNVIAFFDHGRAIARLAAYTDMDPIELTLVLYGGALEDQYERDERSTEEYVRDGLLNGRLRCSHDEFLAAFVDIFWPNEEVCELIPLLKPRYRLLLASNTTRAHYDAYVEQFSGVLRQFDYLGTSFVARARKPESAFFVHIQQHAQCAPNECLFIDDLHTNVEAAESFGWKSIVYRPDGTLSDKLKAVGVKLGTT